MQPSQNCIDLIKRFEGLRLNAYLDSVGVPTIGWGTTMYPDGSKPKIGDTIVSAQAEEYLMEDIKRRSAAMGVLPVNQNQFDALVCFCYNVGLGAFNKSTLRKKVIANSNDPDIRLQFRRWNKAGGQVLNGLTKRREAEADLYFS